MRLTDFSVRNHPFTITVFLGLAALGVVSFLRIPRAEDPALRIPAFHTIVVSPGANPIDLERLVARPLEDAIKELDDVKKLQSVIRDGAAVVSVEFDYSTDADRKYDEVLRQVNEKRADFPAGTQRVEVRKIQTENVSLLQVALVSSNASYARLQDVAEALRRRFETVEGVRRAETHAFPEKQVRVAIDPDRLAATRIPLEVVARAIAGSNAEVPGGAAEAGPSRFTIKTTGSYTNLDDVLQTPLRAVEGRLIRVGDIADVAWQTESVEYFGRFNGERAVFVTAVPQVGRNVLPIRDDLVQVAERFRPELPADVELKFGFDQTDSVRSRLGRLEHDFYIAVGLVLLTVLPLGLRSSLVVLVSIPLSLAMGITMLDFSGYSLNQLSIVGLVIALGLLVDDSIVVVENIARFRREGVPPREAAVRATRQISAAVLGTTATMLFAFLPLLILPGGPGQFIRSLPLAVIYTVLASLLVSLTIVPFLASLMLGGRQTAEGNALLRALQGGIERLYGPILHQAMQNRTVTLVAAAVLVAASLALLPRIGFSLFPKSGVPVVSVHVEGGEGMGIAGVDAVVRRVEAIVRADPATAWWYASIGRGNPQVYYNALPANEKANLGEVVVGFKQPMGEREVAKTAARLREHVSGLAGARITVREFENGPPVAAPIEVRVYHDNLDELARLAREVEVVLGSHRGTRDVDNVLRTPRTDLRVELDRDRAAVIGVSDAEVDRAVRLAFAGLPVSHYRELDGDEYAIQLALTREDRPAAQLWSAIRVQTASGAYIPLDQIARLKLASAPALVRRHNRERCAGITAQVRDGFNTAQVTSELRDLLTRKVAWPPGSRWEFGGEDESRRESFGGIGYAVVIAVFGILAILVLEFRSFRGTLVVASVVPLGIIGGLVALWLAGYSLSFTAAIGFVALIGIEIKNSILLVDFTNQLRAQGVELREAIERAGRVRFLPVVLTTLTALGALLPLAVQGSSLFSPLAVVIIGGLISSLLLTRLVTPVLYSLIPPPEQEAEG